MMQYVCVICDHVHNEEIEGKWEELPDEFMCPECGGMKMDYEHRKV